ncbi:metalloregulator ArsR/SmtB family transcription factor [soil metagenome]
MARQRTTLDVFNAVGDVSRRDILDALADGETTVEDLVNQLGLSQPQTSKHMRVLRDVDLVRYRTLGRHRIYRIHGPAFAPLQSWLSELTASINEHYDRLDDYLDRLQSAPTRAARKDP